MKRSTARCLIGATLTVAGVAAYACFGGLISSVHFYTYTHWDSNHFVDFGRIPQANMVPGRNNEMVRMASDDLVVTGFVYSDYLAHVQTTIAHARNLEVAGHYRDGLKAFESVADTDARRSFVRDRREVLSGKSGRPKGNLAVYLRSRYILEFWPKASHDAVIQDLDAIKDDTALAPNIAYALASAEGTTRRDFINRYSRVAARFPNHPRGQAAAVMVGIKSLSRGSDTLSSAERVKGTEALETLLATYPETPFRFVALGWLARSQYLRKDFDGALANYLLQLDASSDVVTRFKALDSVAVVYEKQGLKSQEIVCHLRQRAIANTVSLRLQASLSLHSSMYKLGAEDVEKLRASMQGDSELLDGYLDFRIEDSRLSETKEAELREFASNAVSNLPRASTGLLVRVAQLDYNSGEYVQARDVARRVLSKSPDSLEGFQARYILASSLGRLGDVGKGVAEFKKLIAAEPPEWIGHGAKEALALLYERQGDMVSALHQYRELEYENDVAFLADAKLTPEQLARAIKGVPLGPERDVLQYTLGMRYLRTDQYDKARRAFLAVPVKTRPYGGLSIEEFEEWVFYFDDKEEMSPLKTVDDLAGFDRVARNARGNDAKAQALYDKAAYIYNHRDLLYYSPGLWRGNRAFMFGIYWSRYTNESEDIAARDRHFDEHECLAHSMRICKEIINKYPTSEIRPEALYMGALSAWKVSNLNHTWRERGTPLRKQAIDWLTQLATEYPRHELASNAAKYARLFKADDDFSY